MSVPVPLTLLQVQYIKQGDSVYKVLVPQRAEEGQCDGESIIPYVEQPQNPIICQVQDLNEFQEQCSVDKAETPHLTSFIDLSSQFQTVKSLVRLKIQPDSLGNKLVLPDISQNSATAAAEMGQILASSQMPSGVSTLKKQQVSPLSQKLPPAVISNDGRNISSSNFDTQNSDSLQVNCNQIESVDIEPICVSNQLRTVDFEPIGVSQQQQQQQQQVNSNQLGTVGIEPLKSNTPVQKAGTICYIDCQGKVLPLSLPTTKQKAVAQIIKTGNVTPTSQNNYKVFPYNSRVSLSSKNVPLSKMPAVVHKPPILVAINQKKNNLLNAKESLPNSSASISDRFSVLNTTSSSGKTELTKRVVIDDLTRQDKKFPTIIRVVPKVVNTSEGPKIVTVMKPIPSSSASSSATESILKSSVVVSQPKTDSQIKTVPISLTSGSSSVTKINTEATVSLFHNPVNPPNNPLVSPRMFLETNTNSTVTFVSETKTKSTVTVSQSNSLILGKPIPTPLTSTSVSRSNTVSTINYPQHQLISMVNTLPVSLISSSVSETTVMKSSVDFFYPNLMPGAKPVPVSLTSTSVSATTSKSTNNFSQSKLVSYIRPVSTSGLETNQSTVNVSLHKESVVMDNSCNIPDEKEDCSHISLLPHTNSDWADVQIVSHESENTNDCSILSDYVTGVLPIKSNRKCYGIANIAPCTQKIVSSCEKATMTLNTKILPYTEKPDSSISVLPKQQSFSNEDAIKLDQATLQPTETSSTLEQFRIDIPTALRIQKIPDYSPTSSNMPTASISGVQHITTGVSERKEVVYPAVPMMERSVSIIRKVVKRPLLPETKTCKEMDKNIFLSTTSASENNKEVDNGPESFQTFSKSAVVPKRRRKIKKKATKRVLTNIFTRTQYLKQNADTVDEKSRRVTSDDFDYNAVFEDPGKVVFQPPDNVMSKEPGKVMSEEPGNVLAEEPSDDFTTSDSDGSDDSDFELKVSRQNSVVKHVYFSDYELSNSSSSDVESHECKIIELQQELERKKAYHCRQKYGYYNRSLIKDKSLTSAELRAIKNDIKYHKRKAEHLKKRRYLQQITSLIKPCKVKVCKLELGEVPSNSLFSFEFNDVVDDSARSSESQNASADLKVKKKKKTKKKKHKSKKSHKKPKRARKLSINVPEEPESDMDVDVVNSSPNSNEIINSDCASNPTFVVNTTEDVKETFQHSKASFGNRDTCMVTPEFSILHYENRFDDVTIENESEGTGHHTSLRIDSVTSVDNFSDTPADNAIKVSKQSNASVPLKTDSNKCKNTKEHVQTGDSNTQTSKQEHDSEMGTLCANEDSNSNISIILDFEIEEQDEDNDMSMGSISKEVPREKDDKESSDSETFEKGSVRSLSNIFESTPTIFKEEPIQEADEESEKIPQIEFEKFPEVELRRESDSDSVSSEFSAGENDNGDLNSSEEEDNKEPEKSNPTDDKFASLLKMIKQKSELLESYRAKFGKS